MAGLEAECPSATGTGTKAQASVLMPVSPWGILRYTQVSADDYVFVRETVKVQERTKGLNAKWNCL